MTPFRALTDQRARPFILLGVFISMLWLVAIIYVIDLSSLYFQNSEDTATLATLNRKIAEAPPKAMIDLQSYVIREVNQSLAAASLQKSINMIAADLDVTIRSFEAISPRQDDATGRIAAEIQFEIDEHQVAPFLHAIENFKPAIIFEHLSLFAKKDRDSNASNRLQGTGTVVSAWQVSP